MIDIFSELDACIWEYPQPSAILISRHRGGGGGGGGGGDDGVGNDGSGFGIELRGRRSGWHTQKTTATPSSLYTPPLPLSPPLPLRRGSHISPGSGRC